MLVISCAVLAIVLAVAGFFVANRATSASAVSPGNTKVSAGVWVTLSPAYHASATPAPVAALRSIKGAPVKPLVKMLDYHASKPVPHGTQIRYQAPKGLPVGAVFDAYWVTGTRTWIHEPVIYNPRTGVAVATVNHFSVHELFSWNLDWVKQAFKDAFAKMFGGLFGSVDHPVCGATNGVFMYYTGGDSSVYPCHDATVASLPTLSDPGKANIDVKLANARNYSIDLSRPDGSSVSINDNGKPDVELADYIGGAITRAVSSRSGEAMSILPGGATGKVTVNGVKAPFGSLQLHTQLDGEAYLTGILNLAVDELGWMYSGAKTSLTQDILDEISKGQIIYTALTQLESVDLSFDTVSKLTGLAKDIVLDAINHDALSPLGLLDAGQILFDAVSSSVQTLVGSVDNLSGAAFHKYTFGTYGHTWDKPLPGLRTFDWLHSAITIPGSWFDGPASVQVNASGHTTVQTPHGLVMVTAAPDRIVYGDLLGNGQDDAALQVWADTARGGTAASQIAQAWVIYQPGQDGRPAVLGVVTPRVAPITAWGVNPHNAPHISFIANVQLGPGAVKCLEFYYRPGDNDAQPSGRAHYQYGLVGGILMPPPDIFPPPTY